MRKKIKLLIVDDSQMLGARLYEMISNISTVDDLHYVGSFEEAVAFLGRKIPDVILLDLNLNGRSGIDLLHYLKTNHYSTKVIIITNETNPHYKETCLQLGAEHFIDKSLDFNKIAGIIEAL